MSTTSVSGMRLTRRWAAFLAVCCLALVGVGGYLLGVHNTKQANWHTVTVDLASVAADESGPHRLLSITADGWTYAIEDTVTWTDSDGNLHDGGWPACLEPAHPGFMTRNHKHVRIRFAEVTSEADGFGWRPVVLVDCMAPSA